MNNKSYFLQCICAIIFLAIFSSCNSNSDKVKEMEKIIMLAHTKANNIGIDTFLNDANINDLFTYKATKHDIPYFIFWQEAEGCHLDSITYIGHNWFQVSYNYCGGDCQKVYYWKIVEKDDKFKLDDVAYTYSQCTSQIKDLPYIDRIRFWFNSIKYDAQPYFQGNLCKVRNDDKYGFINLEGEEILPCKYDDITFVFGDILKIDDEYSRFISDRQDNLLQVKLNNKYGIIDLEGKEIIPCKYDDLTIFDWNEKLLQVKLDNKYGLINLEGKEIIPCKYDDLKGSYDAVEGIALVQIETKLNNKHGIINLEGKEIIPCKYDYINTNDWYEEWLDVKMNNKYGIINSEGKVIIPCKYDDLKGFDWSNNLFLVKLDNKYGLINSERKEFISCKYDDLILFDAREKLVKVKLDNKYGIVDFEGKEIIPCSFDHIDPLEDGKMLKVQRELLWSYYTANGTQVTDFYEDIEYYYNLGHPIFAAESNGKWGYLDESGNILIGFILDYAGTPYKDGTAYVTYNGKSAELDIYSGYIRYYKDNTGSNSSNSSNSSYTKRKCRTCNGNGSTAVMVGGVYRGQTRCPDCGGLGFKI